MKQKMKIQRTSIPNLEGNELVVDHDLLRQEIGADRGLVLIAEFLVHILVHQAGLTDTAVAQDDDLQQNLLSRGHDGKKMMKLVARLPSL
jgi:hypothetical protein